MTHSHQAKYEANVKVLFDICQFFFHHVHFSFDLFLLSLKRSLGVNRPLRDFSFFVFQIVVIRKVDGDCVGGILPLNKNAFQ